MSKLLPGTPSAGRPPVFCRALVARTHTYEGQPGSLGPNTGLRCASSGIECKRRAQAHLDARAGRVEKAWLEENHRYSAS